jgi:hypothetical protein
MTLPIGKQVIDALALLYPALYFNQAVLAGEFSKVSVLIQVKFPSLTEYCKQKLKISKQARILQISNYSAKITKENANLRELTDTKVLDVISTLRPLKDYISQLVLVGLCVGSRISEIIMVSTYREADNPSYIEIVGVAKEKKRVVPQEDEKDEKEEKKEGAEAKRTFTKPVILLTSEEIINVVISIREQLERKYGFDLGEGEGNEPTPEPKKLVNHVDAKANQKVRELFGPEFVFHELRSIYAQMAFMSYAPPGVSQTYYYSQVLGHRENSLTTALSYQKFAIRRKLKEDDPDLVTKITNLEVEMKDLKTELKNEIKQAFHQNPGEEPKNKYEVSLYSRAKGLHLTLKKEPRIQEGPEKRMARLRTLVEKMLEAGIRPTHRNVASLGFGSKIVTQYFKQEKKKKQEEKKEEKKEEKLAL